MGEVGSINAIVRDVVRAASAQWKQQGGLGISFIFGDWPYIADTLTQWGKNLATAPLKFPCIALYSPFTERRGGNMPHGQTDAEISLLILTNTRPEYENETREKVSFDGVLRPIYRIFMRELERSRAVVKPYRGTIEHEYRENYRYGRSGVKGSDGKTFFDYIDAIEINRMRITFRSVCALQIK